jgi:hypothetical protein
MAETITPNLKKYVESHIDRINLHIRQNDKLQPSMDFLKPIIEEFKSKPEHKKFNLDGCPECIIDMLRWARKESGLTPKPNGEETKETKSETKK